ncbi:Uncharacterized protein TCM_026428 [Theobroma cacao]|uniref:Uncharacterized protein n=1 Tax=Theobroma cacao TaxID=3641 RepID=A0A061F1J4_THECC|nr:Uncharacterized protein TCM_026428 [Theobroma cacao]
MNKGFKSHHTREVNKKLGHSLCSNSMSPTLHCNSVSEISPAPAYHRRRGRSRRIRSNGRRCILIFAKGVVCIQP